ncbi:ammonium transporter [Glutamicibacter sp. MNS18]|uniref:ammonium transporter n=1 Tax=Glutamicibacter sp. MNS18 TaxID=2989817 RepID=UPI00223563B2|nr:ammonium transporter [Glutamicibacter sp. MNS18]MCW4466781.1 ammonium transporter [Glutamicibacter sp. MNS18]
MEPADIAWILAAFAMVLLMFPGLAMLYGGMLNGRNVLNMMLMVLSSLAVTGVVYVVVGHGLVLGDSVGGAGLIGNPFEFSFFSDFLEDDAAGGTLWAAFYVLFAAISVALVASGAAGRMRFGSWMVFVALWVLLVYCPLGHWVFAFDNPEAGTIGGWMRNQLVLHDFAGGTAVHMNAGAAGLALAVVLGKRKSMKNRPHNLPLMLVGVGLLATGWMGFNGGTAGGANFTAQYVILTTLLALCGGMLGFIAIERIRDGHATLLGMGTGAISGMVGITPVADAVGPVGAILVGFLAAAAAAWAITWKRRHQIDDSLDVFAVHGIAGITGSLFAVFFANPQAPGELAGIVFGGGFDLLGREVLAITVTLVYSFAMTFAIAWVMNKIRPIRVSEEDEEAGLDRAIHAETAYDNRTF